MPAQTSAFEFKTVIQNTNSIQNACAPRNQACTVKLAWQTDQLLQVFLFHVSDPGCVDDFFCNPWGTQFSLLAPGKLLSNHPDLSLVIHFFFETLCRTFMSSSSLPGPTVPLNMHILQRPLLGLRLLLAHSPLFREWRRFQSAVSCKMSYTNLPAFSKDLPYLVTSQRHPFCNCIYFPS